MKNNYKVRCLEAKYDAPNDMLVWKLFFIEKKAERTFAFPANDFKTSRNISGDISSELWEKFCLDITNKEFNFVMEEEDAAK
jgi:hypothetical protein